MAAEDCSYHDILLLISAGKMNEIRSKWLSYVTILFEFFKMILPVKLRKAGPPCYLHMMSVSRWTECLLTKLARYCALSLSLSLSLACVWTLTPSLAILTPPLVNNPYLLVKVNDSTLVLVTVGARCRAVITGHNHNTCCGWVFMMGPWCYNNNMWGVDLLIVNIIHPKSNRVIVGV